MQEEIQDLEVSFDNAMAGYKAIIEQKAPGDSLFARKAIYFCRRMRASVVGVMVRGPEAESRSGPISEDQIVFAFEILRPFFTTNADNPNDRDRVSLEIDQVYREVENCHGETYDQKVVNWWKRMVA